MPGFSRRETTHIIYPEFSTPSSNPSRGSSSPGSEESASNPFSRLTESIRLKFRKTHPGTGRELRKKCRAFIVDRVQRRDKGKEWIASLDGVDCDDIEESEAEGDWTLLDKIEEFEDDDFFPLELRSFDLEPKIGFSLDIPVDAVRKGRKIGEGAFGLVYRAIYKNRLVVLKEIAPHHYDTRNGRRFIASLQSELRVLGAMGAHPNVLECYGGSVQMPNVFMLCQLMDMNLADLIYGQADGPAPLSVELTLHIIHDVLAGLNHLHNTTPQIVHRDIKPENILLNKKKRACVADFGLSRTKSHTYINTDNTHAGTPEYLAPEVSTGKINEKMDVYSVGVILWECLMAQRPWEGYHPFAVFLNVSEGQRLPLPESVFPTSEHEGEANVMFQVRKMIERSWLSPPDRRPSCAELMDDIDDIFLDMYNHGE